MSRATLKASEELADALLAAVRNDAMLLRQEPVREATARFIRSVHARFPGLREAMRLEVHRVLHGGRKHWTQATQDDLAWLEQLHGELEDKSPAGQLRQVLSQSRRLRTAQDSTKLESLAQALHTDLQLLAAQLPWLTSGDAGGVWDLGEALGRIDKNGTLLDVMIGLDGRGSDVRLLAGYLQARATEQAPGWIDEQIDEIARKNPRDVALTFELTWRCAPTDRGAERLTQYANDGQLQPTMVAHVVFGAWSHGPSISSLIDFLSAIVSLPEFKPAALEIVEQRLSQYPEDLAKLEQIALELVATNDLLLLGPSGGYSWAQVAKRLLPQHARVVAKTIFACQGHRDENPWFIDHSEAAEILLTCAAIAPAEVWADLQTHLARPDWQLFIVGFPRQALNKLPRAAILEWVEEAPIPRAPLLAAAIEKDFADGTIGAELLHHYRKLEDVGDAFFSAYASGAWSGPASLHWEDLAKQLDVAAEKSSLAGVRAWAAESAMKLRRMAHEDRRREEEGRVRRMVR